uniref:Sorbitol dehydrogenase n=1 Tax=Strigamia maritima TaxID=126957 RepID=T1IX42_STRMM
MAATDDINIIDNLSLVLHKTKDLRLEQRPIPEIGDNDCLVAINSVGICGSDVHYWIDGRIADFIVTEPLVLGHEASGTIAKVGRKVKNFKKGDRVALEVGIPCRACHFCKNGRYNLCPKIKFAATPPHNGTLTRFYAQPEDFCFKLPENVSFEEGALVEPLSVAVSACSKGKVSVGEKVLILGSGPIGLLCMMVAKSAGIFKCCITDVDLGRLEFAEELGADHKLLINDGMTEKDIVNKIEEIMNGKPDVTIECSGAESAIRTGILATKEGGRLVLVGMGPSEVKVPLLIAAVKEVDIIGNFRYCNCYPTALALIATGKVEVMKLITHCFNMENSLEAFEVSRSARDGAVKVMIKCAQETQPRSE